MYYSSTTAGDCELCALCFLSAQFRVHSQSPGVIALQSMHNPDWWLALYDGVVDGKVSKTIGSHLQCGTACLVVGNFFYGLLPCACTCTCTCKPGSRSVVANKAGTCQSTCVSMLLPFSF